jgi:hypothetical protein
MTGREYHLLISLADQLDIIAKQKTADAGIRREDKCTHEADFLEGKAAAYKDSADSLRLKLAEMNS